MAPWDCSQEGHLRLDEGPVASSHTLQLTSGSACRYPFYMLGSFNTEWKSLTWLRYTIWIPIYPLGVLAEGECHHCKYKEVKWKELPYCLFDWFYWTRTFKRWYIPTDPSQLLLWCSPFPCLTRAESSVSPCQKPLAPPSASHTSCTSISSSCFWVSSPWNIVTFVVVLSALKHLRSFPSFRTFYQLSTSVQTAKAALRYQKTESQLSLSHTAATPLLPASYSWRSRPGTCQSQHHFYIRSTFYFRFFWVTKKWCLTCENAVRF